MNQSDLEKLLHDQIPMAAAMNVKVLRSDDKTVELSCPLAPNHNHIGTAFGGSLSTLMILAAYCRLFVIMGGNGHVLLKSNSTVFLKPVKEELHAVSHLPDQITCNDFLNAYRRKKRARITLTSEIILSDGTVACRMTGEFVGTDI